MNNDEKKEFIITLHKEFMKERPYDGDFSIDIKRAKEDVFWRFYVEHFKSRVPQKLYKYRTFSAQNLDAFENDYAWFSAPSEFGDMVDSTVNTDIESELEEIDKNPQLHLKKLSIAMINVMLAPYGQTVDEKLVDSVLPLFNENGEVNEADAKNFLSTKIPDYASDKFAKQLVSSTQIDKQTLIFDAIKGFLNVYLDFNKRIRKDTLALCLAEEGNNPAMWETYAGGATGYCIEYSFPESSFLAQRMLLNLFPIYYGKKEHIKFFDVLIRGLQSKQQINGISFEDYSSWFLSSFTKDPSYTFQKEWRIVLTKEIGGNKQSFPFAKSIILGERISDDNKEALIRLAKNKGLQIFQRKLNSSCSKIIVEEIKY